MVLTVIGTGFVGVVTSAVFADNSHTVYGLDIDVKKISSLKNGDVPFFEPDLKKLVEAGVASGKLLFTTDYEESISKSDVVMIAVGTPSNHDGSANLEYVIAAAESLAPHLKDGTVVVIKSTVPPGTHTKIDSIIGGHTSVRFSVAAVPEFLREGTAVSDTVNPDRVVLGIDDEWAKDILLELHSFLPEERMIVSRESASLGKYAANTYLAARITFANQMANICEKTGASISEVLSIAGKDSRIGEHYWYPGLGYGGSCFPKDVKELATIATKLDMKDHLAVSIDRLNENRIETKMKDFEERISGFSSKRVAVLGLSFKPNTTDMREAPSLAVIPYLIKSGAEVVGFDPEANSESRRHFPSITYAPDLETALTNAQVIMLLVEWDELAMITPDLINSHADTSVVVIDTRNQYDRQVVLEAGIEVIQIGNG